jgi:hypothetical protein
VALFIPALLTSCGSRSVQADFGDVTVHRYEAVELAAAPQVLVQPRSAPARMPTAAFFPFRVMQGVEGRDYVGREVGRVFWQTWVRDEVFPIFEFRESMPWRGGRRAVAAARALGADLAVGGEITRVMAGGTVGATRLALRVEIYDTVSGSLVWSMAHAGQLERQFSKDYIFYEEKSHMPADPLYAVATAIAMDLARPVKSWLAGVEGFGPAPF